MSSYYQVTSKLIAVKELQRTTLSVVVLSTAAFFTPLVTFLAIKQNYNEVKMELKLAEHILYLPKIPHFIKVVLLCHFQCMLFSL